MDKKVGLALVPIVLIQHLVVCGLHPNMHCCTKEALTEMFLMVGKAVLGFLAAQVLLTLLGAVAFRVSILMAIDEFESLP
ncbi:hypothetical protein BaRGS_00021271, partial [Batillaria attramentaria]